MQHYVAYNKNEEWGEQPAGDPRLCHYSGHPKSRLEKTIGQNVWVISGEHIERQMVYKLCGVYVPTDVEDDGDGFRVIGRGHGFDPLIEVTYCPWLPDLLKEQNNFRFGLNQIRVRRVIAGLIRLRESPPKAGFPDEIAEPRKYPEGAKRRIVVNAYERNEQARAACIAHYGPHCVVCGFDFVSQYGELGAGLIHVHHLKSLSEIRKTYEVHPIKDLRPVCPNCHAIIHRREPALSVEEARTLLRVKFRWAKIGRA